MGNVIYRYRHPRVGTGRLQQLPLVLAAHAGHGNKILVKFVAPIHAQQSQYVVGVTVLAPGRVNYLPIENNTILASLAVTLALVASFYNHPVPFRYDACFGFTV